MKNLIKTTTRATLMVTGLMTVVACAPEGSVGQFYREAGSQLETGEFGNATLHNQLAQTCNRSGAGGKASGAAGDPLVVLDPKSSPQRPIYRVHCNGRLDGKYASVIYNGYVGSAVPQSTVREADGS